MKKLERKILFDLYEVSVFVLPAVVALIISQLVTLQVYLWEDPENRKFLASWRALQLIPAFIYAYISDRHYRKGALVVSHVLGLLVGLIFFFLKMPFYALIFIGLTFNPISVARAALLDNFPHYSSLKLVAVTYFALYIPWVVYDQFRQIPLDYLMIATFALLFFNAILTALFFQDRKDLSTVDHSLSHVIPKTRQLNTLLTIIGFLLSQATMEIIWMLVHDTATSDLWMNLTNAGFILGFIGAVLYKKLPHMSMLTVTYATGLGISLISIIGYKSSLFTCTSALFSSMSYYSVLAGIYLPFVTDAVMSMFSPRRKAVASAVIEFANLLAVLLAYAVTIWVTENMCTMLYIITFFFLIASILQRKVEKSIEGKKL